MLVLADEMQRAAAAKHLHTLLEGPRAGGTAHGVDDELGADAVGEPLDRRHRVFLGRVDHVVRA